MIFRQIPRRLPRTVAIVAVVAAAPALAVLGQRAFAQDAPAAVAQASDAKAQADAAAQIRGLPPRAAPADYQGHTAAGPFTLAAEFKGHAITTLESTFSSEDYVAIEVALFGPPGAHVQLSTDDFVLRINADTPTAKKKPPMTTQPFALVFKSLKDPQWEPVIKEESKNKTNIGGGDSGQNDPPPAAPKMPFELRRAMEQRVQKASLPEGDRPLPVAGLIFFAYHSKTDNLRSIVLGYNGPSGKASIDLR